jgi:hypothetical protein
MGVNSAVAERPFFHGLGRGANQIEPKVESPEPEAGARATLEIVGAGGFCIADGRAKTAM